MTTLVPNAENSLSTPVLLPCMNVQNLKTYDGTTDLVLTCEGIAGLKMTIKANSMRKPDGTLVTPANPAAVSLNQVHADQIPMPMPDGASPPFAWTLQPGGAHFDPPIAIEYPNMSGLPAGAIAYFLSFNHDTERFEIVASGHVTADGSTIVSDPNAGLTIAGWGCNCPPYSVTGGAKNCCGVAVVLFKGSVTSMGSLAGVGGALEAIATNLKSTFPGKVFAKTVKPYTDSEDAITDAKNWLEEQFAACPVKPKTMLVGHSLGGDIVTKSSSIPPDFRITIDPISRELALVGILYQRPYTFNIPVVVNANYLSEDLIKPVFGFDGLRGFEIAGLTSVVVPGTDHNSIAASPVVALGVTQGVQSLLPPEKLRAFGLRVIQP